MTANVVDLQGVGTQVCSYVVRACYPGKKPFLIGTFSIPRGPTFHETEVAAEKEMDAAVARFFRDCYPDGTKPPLSVKAHLGSVTFVPDDYEWRRGR